MPELKIKFDRHGLGDVVHFAHALQLYRRRGWDVTVQIEENKRFAWEVAGVNIVQGGDLPDHPYIYPAGFEDLSSPDHVTNKVAFGLRHDVMPPDSLGLTSQEAWDELCQVKLSAKGLISPEISAEADRFLEGLPRPIVSFHSRGTNWHERKSIPTEIAFETILRLLEVTGGSVVVLDWDGRAPMVGHERCRGIVPAWGKLTIDRLCALYERSDLMIGVDSGPFHVASFTDVKALGVFRTLHPPRVCLPNANAVYLVSQRYQQHWDERRDKWNFVSYAGDEPTPDEIVTAAQLQLRSPGPVRLEDSRSRFAGRYTYRRVGHDERPLELLLDGTIAEGRGDCERTWLASNARGVSSIAISGQHGIICHCVLDPDGIFRGHWERFERMPIELQPEKELYQPATGFELQQLDFSRRLLAHAYGKGTVPRGATVLESSTRPCLPPPAEPLLGEYYFERIGECEFPVKLLRAGAVESQEFYVWTRDGDLLSLSGKGITVNLRQDPDGCWRGGRDEMIRASRQPFRSFGKSPPVNFKRGEYLYTTLETFKELCIEFARSLPPVRAIAGVPRSGLLAATLVASELNCPMIPIESLLDGQLPQIPVPRRGRGNRFQPNGLILVIDDTCSSGRVISALRPKLHPEVKIGVIVGNDQADFVCRQAVRDVHQSYEWTILHDDNAEFTLTDMDGVLCEDWTGGDETASGGEYERWLENVRPRRIPSYPLLGIVTNRLEQHRRQTEDWLSRHGIRYQELIMSPHPTFRDRDEAADAAQRKADAYQSRPLARLFIESCARQANEISARTGRPVLSIEQNRIV